MTGQRNIIHAMIRAGEEWAQVDWIQSIQRAINYIESNLFEEELDNDSVARQAFSSSANFQRMFGMVTGVTVSDYIRCRRLTLAGEEISYSEIKVIDAAQKYGYETPESFAKAFSRFHGITPSEARNGAGMLKRFEPILLRIEVRGGYNMNTKMIPNLPPLINSWFGENYHINGAARYVMGCLGEMKFSDYSLFAGLTGDIFTQFYPLGRYRDDSASDYYLGLRGLAGIFGKVGYEAEAFSEKELFENRELAQKIIRSIDRGIPVVWHHGSPKGVIVGYEGSGESLFYISSDKNEPERITLDGNFFDNSETDIHGFIVVGRKTREVSLREIYSGAVAFMPTLLSMKTESYVFGAGAFRAWADFIENGGYNAMSPDEFNGNYFAYEIYVVNLATNSGGCQAFLEKAQEICPEYSFLVEIRKLYRMTNYLWNGGHWVKDVHTPDERAEMVRLFGEATLESMGGGFGCKYETLCDKALRSPIVRQLRRFADCIDEVVRILNANLNK